MENDLPIEAQRFKQLRFDLNLTQQAFAEILQLKGAIADIERGKSKLSGLTVSRLYKQYDINPLWLYGESDQKYQKANEASVQPKVITLNASQQENIALVPVKASAGYASNLQDPDWYENLPVFELPLPEYRNATFRAFQVSGDSMFPVLHSGEWVIAKAEEQLPSMHSEDLFVVVLQDSVLVKKLRIGEKLQLISINREYPLIEAELSEVREIWKVTGKISTHFDAPEYDFDRLASEMRAGFEQITNVLTSK